MPLGGGGVRVEAGGSGAGCTELPKGLALGRQGGEVAGNALGLNRQRQWPLATYKKPPLQFQELSTTPTIAMQTICLKD